MVRTVIRQRLKIDRASWKVATVPNCLTLVRIGVLPFLVGVLLTHWAWKNWLALGLFAFAGLTDYFDGFIARKFKQVSRFGAFIDPIADKLLVSTTLLMLAGLGWISHWHLIPTTIILCREFIISGLREFLASSGQDLPSSRIAKYKTAVQMTSIVMLLMQKPAWMVQTGLALLWVAAYLALISGYAYLRASFGFMSRPH